MSSQAVDLEVFEPLEGVDPGGVVFGTHGHDPGARGPLHARRVIKRTLQIKKQFVESPVIPKMKIPPA